MKKATKEEKAKWIAELRRDLPPGSTLHCILRHVSRSGMYRAIDIKRLYTIDSARFPEHGPVDSDWLSYRVAAVCGFRFDEKWEAVGVSGCGMDMGYHIIYSVARTLYPDGFGCVGAGCPSNDHSNGDRDYSVHHVHKAACGSDPCPIQTVTHWHRDGGYALRMRWL